jgi:Zn-ribbon RNA-binding protein
MKLPSQYIYFYCNYAIGKELLASSQITSFLSSHRKPIIGGNTMNDNVCISTKKKITNMEGVAKFNCPSCGKHTIIRSKHARELASKYKCPQCGFEGPN